MKKTLFFLLWVCAVSGLQAEGDESDSVTTIFINNAVIISAQRYETNDFKRPESIAYLGRAQLNAISPMSMPQALSYVSGVWMQKTNHGGGSAFVRGLTGYQTLLMVDGIRMNNSTYRSGPNQYLNTIDPLMVSHIEVLRGSGSVQYGSDAIGGTIHLLSTDPEFSDDGVKIGGSLYGKYWSSNMEGTGRATINAGGKKWAVLAGGTYKNFGDIKAGGDLGTLTPTGYREYSMDFKGILKIKNRHKLTGGWQHLKQMEVPLYHKVVPGDYSIYNFNPQERDLAYLRLESSYDSKFFSGVRYTVSWQNSLEVREKQKTGSPEFVTERDEVNTFGANIEFFSDFSKKWTASSGVELYHDNVASTAQTVNKETGEDTQGRGLYPDGSRYDNLAIYTLHNFDLNRWELTAGLRYNFVQLQVEDTTFGNTTVRPDALVGNFGAVFKLNEHHHLTANINSSFRAPNINDVSSFGIADFRYETPAYDLKPETSWNKEIGYKFKYDDISGAAHIFHNKLNDLIVNVPATYNGKDSLDGYKVYKRRNVDEAVIYGGELELEARVTRSLVAFGNMAYTFGQNISKDEPMRRIPPLFGRLGLRGDIINNLWYMGEWVFAGKQDRLSSGDEADDRIAPGGTPAWNVVNLYAGYNFTWFSINISGQNIFNEAYRVHGSGVDGIGRSFWASLKIDINP